ncbi:MAG: hypothetical protein O9302_05700 [Cyclobacteriaceae bacterium]|nr:hypothetical protein [Cytophagales bacterium]MCZ8327532.1 hypothetical protein [Cyclobacteriaceae bacterium]
MKIRRNLAFQTNLKNLISSLNFTTYKFSKQLGYKRADSVYNLIDARKKLNGAIILRIQENFPDINLNWLLTGTGPMHTSRIGPGGYGNEIVKTNSLEILYPSRLSLTEVVKLSNLILNQLVDKLSSASFEVKARTVAIVGIEIKFIIKRRKSVDRVYIVSISPDWQISYSFDFWRIDDESIRCQKIFDYEPSWSGKMNSIIDEILNDLKDRRNDPEVQPFSNDENWVRIM